MTDDIAFLKGLASDFRGNTRDRLLEIASELERLREATRWRDVNEEMPSREDWVIVRDKYDIVTSGYIEPNGFCKDVWGLLIQPTHWKPMPK